MPIYEYQCDACGKRLEVIQRMADKPLKECPHCKKKKLRKLISASSFQLKGAGWYVTDFRDKKQEKKGKAKPASEKSTEKAEAKAGDKDSAKSAESSPKETAKSTDAGEKKSSEKKGKEKDGD